MKNGMKNNFEVGDVFLCINNPYSYSSREGMKDIAFFKVGRKYIIIQRHSKYKNALVLMDMESKRENGMKIDGLEFLIERNKLISISDYEEQNYEEWVEEI